MADARPGGLWSRVIKDNLRIQGRCRTPALTLAAFWTVKTHAMVQGASEEARSGRRETSAVVHALLQRHNMRRSLCAREKHARHPKTTIEGRKRSLAHGVRL